MLRARKAILRPHFDHRPVTTPVPCPCCGYPATAAACAHCHGSVRALDGRRVLPPAAPDRPWAALAGFAEVRRALFALLHGREYIGLLRLPVTMNAIAFAVVVVGGWLALAPLFDAVFAGPWWCADGLRAAVAARGPGTCLAATWLVLGQPLVDLIAGAAQEPLRARTETRMLGTPGSGGHAPGVLRLRDRARVLAWLVLAWPALLGVALLPWCGLPLLLAAGAAVAALTWFEAPLAARGLSLRGRIEVLRRHRWRALGTGLGLQVAAAVPFVNVLALAPIATLAATAGCLQFAGGGPRPVGGSGPAPG